MSLGCGTRPLKHKTKPQTSATWKEGEGEARGEEGERRKKGEPGGCRALGAGAAAAGLRAWPNWSRETRAGAGWAQRRRLRAPGCASPAAKGARPVRRPSNGPPSPSARPWLPPPRDPVRPAAHNDSRVASPSPAPPFSPAPTRPALTQGRRSRARACASLTSTYCVTASSFGWRGRLPSADYGGDGSRPLHPLVAGRGQPWGFGAGREQGCARWAEEIGLPGVGPIQGQLCRGGILNHHPPTFHPHPPDSR